MADTQVEEATEPQVDEATEAQAPDAPGDEATADAAEVQEAVLPDVPVQPGEGAGGQIDLLLESSMPVSVRLGEVSLQVCELLQLTPGSVLKLDSKAGEPVDLLLRGKRFATGRLVVVGEQLGVRIQDILSSQHPPVDGGQEG